MKPFRPKQSPDTTHPTFFRLEQRQLFSGTVSGNVFADFNLNGTRDIGEGGLAEIRVYCDLNHNGKPDASEPQVQTGPDGSYKLSGLPAGEYSVRSVMDNNLQRITPAVNVIRDTSAPTAVTTPEYSWPNGMGGLNNLWPRRNAFRSVPQVVAASTLITTSPAAGIGVGTSRNSN